MKPLASWMSSNLMIPPNNRLYQVLRQCNYPVGWIITWFSVTQDVFNIVDSLVIVPLWVHSSRMYEFLIMVLHLWCLSSISNEYDDSFLLLLSESLTTLAAFFPTKGELTLLCESLEKVSVITLHGPSTYCNSNISGLSEHVVHHQATLNGIHIVLQRYKEVCYQWSRNLFVHY